ncbi:Putative flippase GtrA (transmembrane translocase of bactoprenol-linked glucose) [Chitinophaga rupis]|uniref:Putative flippase GtrA (Transmembrane translocase of bactoprenol-linked glucose) n=1 Tax=Chitinophaga rupis TaxID=573321 RepID=A0A1H8CQI3_9BACT|nr:GtrA family protein [Chitinophaga rupis]SEM97152.1 Putative flippase GtrA (transmembrane translocase of bactoprenol-linked glucose) [Chitinophaga rupis]
MRNLILQVIDFFHRPFARLIPLQTFRYLACGGGNTALDIVLYFIMYNFVLHKQMVHLPFVTITPHIAALFMSLAITFPTGFLLSKYVVFSESNLRGRTQLFRYFMLVSACILLNYVFMKLFVEHLHIYPTISKILTTFFVVCFSYLTQKKFTFKVKPEKLKLF